MLQAGGAYPGARAGEMLRQVAALLRRTRSTPDWLLDVLGLDRCAGRPYRRLSGGQQQRLALAMAVVGRPELVFLDEPTAGPRPAGPARRLGPGRRPAPRRRHRRAHHPLHGRGRAAGRPRGDHRRRPGGRRRARPAELTAAAPQKAAAVPRPARPGPHRPAAALPADCPAAEPTAGRYLVSGEIDPRLLATVTAWCAAARRPGRERPVDRRTLEDVFLELTGRELRCDDRRPTGADVRPGARGAGAAAPRDARRQAGSSCGCCCATASSCCSRSSSRRCCWSAAPLATLVTAAATADRRRRARASWRSP